MADKNNKGYGVPAAPAVPASPAKPAAPAAPAGRPGKSADNASPNVREVSAKERIDARRRELEKKLADAHCLSRRNGKASCGGALLRGASPSERCFRPLAPNDGAHDVGATEGRVRQGNEKAPSDGQAGRRQARFARRGSKEEVLSQLHIRHHHRPYLALPGRRMRGVLRGGCFRFDR